MQKIILASQSPRRKQLLELAQIPFEVIVKETDETYPPQLQPEEIALHIARNKALAINQTGEITIPILAADTIVVLDNHIIGKPKGRDDAINILSALSGREHSVITGVVLITGNKEKMFTDKTVVKFHPLTQEQVIFYIDNYKPYDKAGAYAIQEWIGAIGIEYINGDFYNVMGLPISKVVKLLSSVS